MNETIADIIAEMREESAKADLEQYYTLDDAAESMREFAGRLEAAWKREKAEWEAAACAFVSDAVMSGKVAVEHAPVGNAAAMREAMLRIVEFAKAWADPGADAATTLGLIIDKAESALAAPPRQCDIGTAEGQSVRMSEFCREQYKKTDGVALCSGCRFHNIEGLDCQFAWAQMPYEAEEGGAGNGVQSAS